MMLGHFLYQLVFQFPVGLEQVLLRNRCGQQTVKGSPGLLPMGLLPGSQHFAQRLGLAQQVCNEGCAYIFRKVS